MLGDSDLGTGCRTPGKPRIRHLNPAFQVVMKVGLSREEKFSVQLNSLMYNR